ncbi:ParB N-terminal domain-containing protein [uncultured Fusobacterium sp.]|uniref:ParB N-terminal domain-containing protein n=1 Tax=uncultured Fusobacterium sp. TaxID=159267 RepID=UPI00259A832B|nr:ParB N-terminal domain-containing protein [uncultured Fusobacterium sp.]
MEKNIKSKIIGIENQPLNKIIWIERDKLHSNNYNPNHVFPKELELLKISILEDGWTQPIVIREDGEIVDGFHRWTVSGMKEIYNMTNGKVPVVILKDVNSAHQIMSTIRHNQARGSHNVLRMADIVKNLIDIEKLSIKEVKERLQMEDEEVERLYYNGDMTRVAEKDFKKGWIPKKK